MKIKKWLRKIKHTHILALAFLVYIAYIGASALPPALVHVAAASAGNPGIMAARNKADAEYKAMLTFTNSFLANKGTYINLNGLMARAMGQREMNVRVRLNNGHLVGVIGTRDVMPAAAEMIRLYNRVAADGKAFLFVLAPSQVSKYEDLMPVGYEDCTNQNSDNMLAILRDADVPVLDLRETLHNEGISHTDAFFKTDHHWKPETGVWAYTKIIERLTIDGTIPAIDPMYTDLAQFQSEVYEDWFLGSSGKRTGRYFVGTDDFSVITPLFDTFLSVSIPSADIEKQGDFATISFNQDANVRDFFLSGPYTGYGHSDRDFVSYRNALAPVDKKLLSIGDSFGNVPLTFMPLAIGSCDELDMRHYTDDFAQYYTEYDPDIVIMLVNNETIAQDNTTYVFFPE